MSNKEALKIVLELAEYTYAEWSTTEDMENERLALDLIGNCLEGMDDEEFNV